MAGMTDLEIMKLCAEAMRFTAEVGAGRVWIRTSGDLPPTMYAPLHDDAQAMALVKRFGLTIIRNEEGAEAWSVGAMGLDVSPHDVDDDDLNRAIVECVAKMQANA